MATPRLLQAAIYSGQINKMVINIIYKKLSTKMIIKRTVEPYEVKEETRKDGQTYTYLYAWDITPSILKKRRHIKKFRMDRFQKISVGSKIFKPKFDIKPWR